DDLALGVLECMGVVKGHTVGGRVTPLTGVGGHVPGGVVGDVAQVDAQAAVVVDGVTRDRIAGRVGAVNGFIVHNGHHETAARQGASRAPHARAAVPVNGVALDPITDRFPIVPDADA